MSACPLCTIKELEAEHLRLLVSKLEQERADAIKGWDAACSREEVSDYYRDRYRTALEDINERLSYAGIAQVVRDALSEEKK